MIFTQLHLVILFFFLIVQDHYKPKRKRRQAIYRPPIRHQKKSSHSVLSFDHCKNNIFNNFIPNLDEIKKNDIQVNFINQYNIYENDSLLTSMDGSEYSTDSLPTNSFESDSVRYFDDDDSSLKSILIYHELGNSYHISRIVKDSKLKYIHMSLYDRIAIRRCGLEVEQVDDISNIGEKLDDLEILRTTKELSKDIYQEVQDMKKPTEFDIYTLIHYKYKDVPKKYKEKYEEKKQNGQILVRRANKVNNIYPIVHHHHHNPSQKFSSPTKSDNKFQNLIDSKSFRKKKKSNDF
jgi:hypothetical protein